MLLGSRYKINKLSRYIEKYYNNVIDQFIDTSGTFKELYDAPGRGAAVILLNDENICLYAFSLERENKRKLYENSGVIFRLIKNFYEEDS